MGSNTLIVRPGAVHSHGVSAGIGEVTRFTFQDVEALSGLAEVKYAGPSVEGAVQAVYGNKNWRTRAQGVDVAYEKIRSAIPTSGRFFTDEDIRTRKKVALLGITVLDKLGIKGDPVGQEIKINKIRFVIIGILPEMGGMGWRDRDDVIFLPITTAMFRILGKQYIDNIDVEVKSVDVIDAAKKSITDLLMKRHRITGDRDSFHIRDMTEMKDAIMSTTRTFSLLLGSIGAIALLVGGIGIMNIMLVTVKERTKEIGLRKAIGARRRDILIQFLIESAFLTFCGGLAGIIIGTAIALVLGSLAGWAVKVSMFSIILSTFFSIFVGVTFGLWPAVQASRLKPIEALRYD
jgi:macrolide transport system ATP-binding/permease protein